MNFSGGAARAEEERESSDSDSSSSSESSGGSKNEGDEGGKEKQNGRKTKAAKNDEKKDTQEDEKSDSEFGPERSFCNLSFSHDGNDRTCKNVILVGKEARPQMTCHDVCIGVVDPSFTVLGLEV